MVQRLFWPPLTMKTMRSTLLQTTGSSTPFRRLGVLGKSLLFLGASVPAEAATLRGLLEIAGQKANPTMGRGRKGRGHKDKASIKDVAVTLYEATEFAPIALATTSTDDNGSLALDIARDTSNSIFSPGSRCRPRRGVHRDPGRRSPGGSDLPRGDERGVVLFGRPV